ncbi:major facilitator superfamily domain-containing protein [Echria macrotheca]|uniref:Major facilitator superfamily domain-containing protein n=1 Tax=Echria macrotheca TaxID=438768 RepID=A0AAJ0BGE9_9PEZI|nr:major facilitator superfamily domain-containing protein [Echria macrotheca]
MTGSTDADETAPLLAPSRHPIHHDANGHNSHDHGSNPLQAQTAESHSLPPATRPTAPARRVVIIAVLFSLAVVLAISSSVLTTAMMQALEDIICRRLGADKLSFDCKDDAVMGELTILTGWDAVFALIPGLLLSVPYGAMADRYGRVPVLGLVMLGLTLGAVWVSIVCYMDGTLDLRLIWLANLCQIIGGGGPVFSSMVFTMLADISTDAQRSTAFLYIGTVLMASTLVAQPITYVAMQQGTWFALGLGMSLLTTSTAVAFCIPETLDKTRAKKVDPTPLTDAQTDGSSSRQNRKRGPLVYLEKAQAAILHTARAMRWLFWEQKLVGFLLLSLACELLGKSVWVAIQQQYISKRYHLTFAEASLVSTVGLATTIVVLSVVLPYLSHILLTRYGYSSRAKDLRLSQVSALLTAAGCVLASISDTLPMFCASLAISCLGIGYTYMIRGLMTSLIGAKDLGLLYASIALVDSVAVLVAMPLFSYLFKFGMQLGGGWIGLPYHVAGVILVGAAVLVSGVREAYVDVDEGEDAAVGGGASRESEEEEEAVAARS